MQQRRPERRSAGPGVTLSHDDSFISLRLSQGFFVLNHRNHARMPPCVDPSPPNRPKPRWIVCGEVLFIMEFSRISHPASSRPANLTHRALVITRYHTRGSSLVLMRYMFPPLFHFTGGKSSFSLPLSVIVTKISKAERRRNKE